MKKRKKVSPHARRVAEDRFLREISETCRQCEAHVEINPHTGNRYRMCPRHRKADCARKKAA